MLGILTCEKEESEGRSALARLVGVHFALKLLGKGLQALLMRDQPPVVTGDHNPMIVSLQAAERRCQPRLFVQQTSKHGNIEDEHGVPLSDRKALG
jgi:hypothetical protein